MSTFNVAELTRPELDAVLKRHLGQKSALADKLVIRLVNISKWLSDPRCTSVRVEAAIREKVAELLELERQGIVCVARKQAHPPGAKRQRRPITEQTQKAA